jgi:hypothetical protein
VFSFHNLCELLDSISERHFDRFPQTLVDAERRKFCPIRAINREATKILERNFQDHSDHSRPCSGHNHQCSYPIYGQSLVPKYVGLFSLRTHHTFEFCSQKPITRIQFHHPEISESSSFTSRGDVLNNFQMSSRLSVLRGILG